MNLTDDTIDFAFRWLLGCSVLVLGFAACHSTRDDTRAYHERIDRWHAQRIESLKEDEPWLRLAGLFWLQPGANTAGSDSSNALVFPGASTPDHIGTFVLDDSTVTLQVAPGVPVRHGQDTVSQMVLHSDDPGPPTRVQLGALSWYIIERSDRYAVRLEDAQNKNLLNFSGIERYPVDRAWRVAATYRAFDTLRSIAIPTVVGEPAQMLVPGVLEFEWNGETYRLTPTLDEADATEFFVVFGDETNGETTYGGGRYLYGERPSDGETTYLDFNKAYNPPCVFTPYATCPLPPPENRLSVAVRAGEKMAGMDSVDHTTI